MEHTRNHSMIIQNQTSNRLLSLQILFFLEFCGYSVLEDTTGKLESIQNCTFSRIIIGESRKTAGFSGIIYCSAEDDWQEVLERLCEDIAADEEDGSALRILRNFYDKKTFQALYTITFLYYSRLNNYGKQEKLKTAAKRIAAKCPEIEEYEKDCTLVSLRRIMYARLYMADKANEGYYKLREYPYYSHWILEDPLRRLKKLWNYEEQSLLLEANIMRNTDRSFSDLLEAYGRLKDADSFCVRYYALCALGEIETERADIAYRKWIYDDENCVIRTRLDETAMTYFERCHELKSDEMKALYKLGLQFERKGLTSREFLREAGKYWENLIRVIKSRPIKCRTTQEFEYLFKALIMIGNVLKLQGRYAEALQKYEEAESMWDDLPKYELFSQIYKNGEKIQYILNKRYRNINSMLRTNQAALKKRL